MTVQITASLLAAFAIVRACAITSKINAAFIYKLGNLPVTLIDTTRSRFSLSCISQPVRLVQHSPRFNTTSMFNSSNHLNTTQHNSTQRSSTPAQLSCSAAQHQHVQLIQPSQHNTTQLNAAQLNSSTAQLQRSSTSAQLSCVLVTAPAAKLSSLRNRQTHSAVVSTQKSIKGGRVGIFWCRKLLGEMLLLLRLEGCCRCAG